MSFIINQNFDLKSPQFNFARDYYKDIATLKAESEDNFPDHFITNVAGTLYQLTKSNSVDATTGKWRELKFGLTSTEIDAKGYLTATDAANKYARKADALESIEPSTSVDKLSLTTTTCNGTQHIYNISSASETKAGILTAADKKKLDGIAEGANKTVADDKTSTTSENPVQNKAITNALNSAITNINLKIDEVDTRKLEISAFNSFKGNVTSIEVCDNATIDAMFV